MTATISRMTGRPVETCSAVLQLAIDLQEPVKLTERLVRDLKAAGVSLCAFEHVARVHRSAPLPRLRLFDGEVVSCEHTVARTAHLLEILSNATA